MAIETCAATHAHVAQWDVPSTDAPARADADAVSASAHSDRWNTRRRRFSVACSQTQWEQIARNSHDRHDTATAVYTTEECACLSETMSRLARYLESRKCCRILWLRPSAKRHGRRAHIERLEHVRAAEERTHGDGRKHPGGGQT